MALGFSQTGGTDQKLTNKIVLIIGQKIIVETNITMEANLSPGMDMNTKSISATTLEVKSRTDTNYIISNTVTKVKLDMDMLGQSTSYDSDKKEDQESEFGKSFADKINKPKDFVIDMVTGKNQPLEKNDPIKNTDSVVTKRAALKLNPVAVAFIAVGKAAGT